MRRLHLIEIEDQAWFPRFLRDAVTDTLQFAFNAGDLYGPVVPHLCKALRVSGARNVVDLCSGGGGPWLRLQRLLEKEQNLTVEVRLGDKYPNFGALERLRAVSHNKITFHPGPVDARDVPSALKGFRTMFTSFHHFQPDDASGILRNAVQSQEGIGVFEVPQRSPLALLLALLAPVAALVFAPFLRPFRWTRLLWTYLIPIVPFVMLFDGIVSCLRAYSSEELVELADGLSARGYRWEAGEVRGGISPVPVTYLIGWSDDAASAATSAASARLQNRIMPPETPIK